MTTEALLLIGRDAGNARELLETHADRLARRAAVDDVAVATYGTEPSRELRERLRSVTADRVYAVPMCAAHSRDTLDRVPGALSDLPGEVRYCEPLGRSPALTDVVLERATERLPPDDDAALVLVGFGSGSTPYHRQVADYHAARLREAAGYGEVLTCYLLQNPAAECVRYNVSEPETVAVPLFLARTEAVERRVPEALELDRGGVEYADPFGDHPRVTDAVHAELRRQRALADAGADRGPTAGAGLEARLTRSRPPVATDGEGR